MDEKNKQLLTRVKDRISFLYIDKARIEQTEYGVMIRQGSLISDVPITTINCLILGPGTSITHRAVANIASAGCSICWMGNDMAAFYAYGAPTTNSGANILTQAKYHENKALHLATIHAMYALRYPTLRLKTKSLEELRGIEGLRVKNCYEKNADKYGISWNGRTYNQDDFYEQDVINQYITSLNHMLYAICTAVITALGYSTSIGFIHTGKVNSFVYDIADLYKEKFVIPAAFQLATDGIYSREKAVNAFRKIIVREKLLKQIVTDIMTLFQTKDNEDVDAQLMLWDFESFKKSGINYS